MERKSLDPSTKGLTHLWGVICSPWGGLSLSSVLEFFQSSCSLPSAQ